jgi:prophage antirepressor-like protein
MPDLIPFSFESKQVRAVEIDGNPWFVAKDVADCLGYDQTANGLKHCRYSSKLDEMNRINGLAPATKWIPESDVYRMVLRSQLDSAERFQDWVCEEVLPQIRKTGSYSAKPQAAPIPRIEVMEREVALCERSYNLAERCDDPVLRVMLIDRAKNALSSTNPALPSSQSGYFQTHQILEDLGYSEKEIRKLAANAGKRLAAAYRTITGMEPEKVERIIDGATRKVSAFPASFRGDAQAVLSQWLSADAA